MYARDVLDVHGFDDVEVDDGTGDKDDGGGDGGEGVEKTAAEDSSKMASKLQARLDKKNEAWKEAAEPSGPSSPLRAKAPNIFEEAEADALSKSKEREVEI